MLITIRLLLLTSTFLLTINTNCYLWGEESLKVFSWIFHCNFVCASWQSQEHHENREMLKATKIAVINSNQSSRCLWKPQEQNENCPCIWQNVARFRTTFLWGCLEGIRVFTNNYQRLWYSVYTFYSVQVPIHSNMLFPNLFMLSQ